MKVKFEGSLFLVLVAGLGCFLLSFIGVGLAPWTTLSRVTKPPQDSMNPYRTESGELTSIGRGRKLYIAEGCWHCHSQFVRPVAGDPYRYGPVSQAWEAMYDVPQVYGTRRIGPDLSRAAGRHSDDWQYAHLYNPRTTVPLSVMPSYPWFFKKEGDKIEPKQEAKDLVAYIQYLGRHHKDEIQSIVYPKIFKVAGAPDMDESSYEMGRQLFMESCIGCHGVTGNGVGPARPFLVPQAADLNSRFISPSEVYSIINRGVLGSSMPSFREMPERDMWAISHFVTSLGENTKTTVLAEFKNVTAAKLERGKSVYQTRCFICHGAKGAGDGPAGIALNPRPKDFTRRLFSYSYLNRVLQKGIPGSAMPPMPDMSEEDRKAVSAYVTSFYQEGL